MAKFKLFSDSHIHPWTAFARLTKKGVNTRLTEILEAVGRIIQDAHEESCDAILFSGDLFHVPKIDAVTMDLTATLLRLSKIPIIMIPGNHDEASKMSRFHTLRSLHGSAGCVVLDRREGQTTTIAGTKISGIPYTTNPKRFLDCLRGVYGSTVVLCHTGFAGATAGFDYIADMKNFVQPGKLGLKDSKIQLLIAGHFHQPQLMSPGDGYESHKVSEIYTPKSYAGGSILIPGAPVHHNFGDVGSRRGSWTLSTTDNTLRFVPGVYSEFVRVEFVPGKVNRFVRRIRGNYVACKVSEAVHVKDVHEILQAEAKGFTLSLEEGDKENAANNRPRLRLEDRQDRTLTRYIKRSKPEGHSVKSLLRAGLKLIQEAEAL